MKEEILRLRAEGKSYNEIKLVLNCSKGTIAYHCGLGQKEKSKNRVKNSRAGLSKSIIKTVKCCKFCGKQLNRISNTFCDKECNISQIRKETLNKFELGLVPDSRTIRGILSDKYGDNCSICGQTSFWAGKSLVLQVDHIDGNSDNNFPVNLRLLCPNCHTQTETFTGGNKTKKDTKRNLYLRKYKGY